MNIKHAGNHIVTSYGNTPFYAPYNKRRRFHNGGQVTCLSQSFSQHKEWNINADMNTFCRNSNSEHFGDMNNCYSYKE